LEDPFSGLAERYLSTNETLRGVVRHALVARQLGEHLPWPPARIADIGGGAEHQGIPLAREGHEVTILDPSRTMLREARRTLASEEEAVRQRARLVEGAGEQAREILGKKSFDAVLCHGVLPYLEDPYPLIRSLASVARPGGIVSVLAKNAAALAMRPALEGRYKDALAAFDADRDLGRLGVVTRGDTIAGLCKLFERVGIEAVRWYGVRVFTDHLGDRPPDANLPDVLRLEWEAGRRDPYRSVARLFHLIGQKPLHRE
jgi:ubiquinone/menaquinone biosynthesis C-methylase UbiE